MKLAILLLCHKNAEQINLFLQTMKHPDIDFYIHVDKKSHITDQIAKRPDIHTYIVGFLACRCAVGWDFYDSGHFEYAAGSILQ